MPDPWGSPEPSIRTARRRPSSAPVPPPPPLDTDEIAERRRARERRQHQTTTTRTETDMAATKMERMRAHLDQVLADDPDVDSERVFEQLPVELCGMSYESFKVAYWYPLRREILGDGPGEEPAESQEDERSDPTPDPAPSPPPVDAELEDDNPAELEEGDTIRVDFGRGSLRARKVEGGHWDLQCNRVSDHLLREILVDLFPPAEGT